MTKRDVVYPEFIRWKRLSQLQDTDIETAIYVKSWHCTINVLS